jgi:YidC/Oxa1 family membrane protein insertase
MTEIFNFFGGALGYLLWFFYQIVRNYGVAIILFTVAMKLLLFPFSIKQQISMAANSKIALKQKELQKKYGNDKEKIQAETQKLYEKEGINPASGCMTMAVPLVILMGLYYTVLYPLQNALHISADAIAKATSMMTKLPGIGSTFNTQYVQIAIVKNFADLQPYFKSANPIIFNGDEFSKMEFFSKGFHFLGLNLLDTPCDPSNLFGTLFRSNLWIIPFLCLASSLASQYFMNKLQPGMQQQQGCMKAMLYVFPLFTAWLACTMPAAIGFYWIISTVTGFLQTLILNIWYNPEDLNARSEAGRIALRETEEAQMAPLPEARRRQAELPLQQSKPKKPKK